MTTCKFCIYTHPYDRVSLCDTECRSLTLVRLAWNQLLTNLQTNHLLHMHHLRVNEFHILLREYQPILPQKTVASTKISPEVSISRPNPSTTQKRYISRTWSGRIAQPPVYLKDFDKNTRRSKSMSLICWKKYCKIVWFFRLFKWKKVSEVIPVNDQYFVWYM